MEDLFALKQGMLAPDFGITGADGRLAKLSDFRGGPVVLAFFSTDWDPSRPHQLVLYNRVFREFDDSGCLIGVASDGDWCEVNLQAEQPRHFAMLPGLADRPDVAKLYGVEGRQALFILDADGCVSWQYIAAQGMYPPADEFALALSKKGLTRRQFLIAAAAVSLAVASLPRASQAQQTPRSTTTRTIRLDINGRRHEFEGDPATTLLDALRERIGLTGTKKGCDHGQCGACTVHVDGRRVNACLILAMQAEGARITTIEGLVHAGQLHPMQAAFIKQDGYQCGYCTPGQIMSAVACIHEGHAGNDAEIKEWMSGNICRCGAYVGICGAIHEAKAAM